jgi:hypothetical protein
LVHRGDVLPLNGDTPVDQWRHRTTINQKKPLARPSTGTSTYSVAMTIVSAQSRLVPERFVRRLAAARIGATFNQYSRSRLRRERLAAYLRARAGAPWLLVGEAAGYRGACVSGIPFTSERQLSGAGPAEGTATIVHRVLADLQIEDSVLLWNVVPTHPHRPGAPRSNRRPTRAEVEAGLPFLRELARGRQAIAVGRTAHAALGGQYVRHPSHGGAELFRAGLMDVLGPSTGRHTWRRAR